MKPLLFAMPGSERLAAQLGGVLPSDPGELRLHQFPDGECCPRFMTAVAARDVVLVDSLDRPDGKILALYLAASVARELGARSIGFVIPYLPYMRQDMQFNPGEGVTSRHFARLLSSCCDWFVTVDPHLHRHRNLSVIYTVPSGLVHAAPEIAKWIRQNVERPFLMGPDEESLQWVSEVADAVGCPGTVLRKVRSGDRAIAVSCPDLSAWTGMTPVLLDDIVSTGSTMIAAMRQVLDARMAPPVCVAVHPVFAGDALAAIAAAGPARIVSCNTIDHPTNQVDLSQPIAAAVGELLGRRRPMAPG